MKRSLKNLLMIIMILTLSVASAIRAEPVEALGAMTNVTVGFPAVGAWTAGSITSIWGTTSGVVNAYAVGYGTDSGTVKPLFYARNAGGAWSASALPLPQLSVPPSPSDIWYRSGTAQAVWSAGTTVHVVGYGAVDNDNNPATPGTTTKPLLYFSPNGGSIWNTYPLELPEIDGVRLSSGYLLGVWGIDANHVYAVGWGTWGTSPEKTVPLFYSFDGSGWTAGTINPAWDYAILKDVWASGSGGTYDIYAVGKGNAGGSELPLVFHNHYDGASWSGWTPPTQNLLPTGWTVGSYEAVWGSGLNDIYAVGSGNTSTSETLPVILHYGNDGWTASSPALPPGWDSAGLDSIWGSSAGDVYLSGAGNNQALTYRKANNGWAASYYLFGGNTSHFHDIWGSGPNDVYAVGFGNNGGDYPLLAHAGSDTTVPGAVINYSATSGACDGSVNLSWKAPADDAGDNNSGPVDSYLVRYSSLNITNGAEWNAATPVFSGLPLPTAPGTTQTMTLSGYDFIPGRLYYFAIRALDEEGGVSPFVTKGATAKAPAPVGVGVYDDTNCNWIYTGNWASYSGPGPYNSTLHYTSTLSDFVQLTFTGTKFTLTFTKDSNRGLVDVFVDGNKVTTINAYSASYAFQQTYTSPSYANGNHTVCLVHAGGRPYIDIDAIQIFGAPVVVPAGTYDDTHSAWSYSGSWASYSGSGPSGNTLHFTSTVGNFAELTFTGTKFALTFTKDSNRGLIDVFVDGNKVTTINAYSASPAFQQTYTSLSYADGNHTVRLVHAGGKPYMDIDAIQIFGALVAVPAGTYDDMDSNWFYTGAWAVYNGSGPSGNTLHFTSTVGNFAELTFTGTKFALTFTKDSNRGLIDVFVDGNKVTTLDAYSASPALQQTYTSLSYTDGTHTVSLVHAGGRPYMDIDAIQIFGVPVVVPEGTYDDADAAWSYYGSWASYSGSGPSNNTLHYTGTVGDFAELTFTGTKFALTFTRDSNRGLIDVFVDGNKVTTLDAYSTSIAFQQTYTSRTFANGTHTVSLVHGGGRPYIDVDAIQIFGAPVAVPDDTYDDADAAWNYSGSWASYSGSGPYSNTLHYTSTVGDFAELAFSGTQFTLLFTKDSNRGLIDVFVDGSKVTTLDAYSASYAFQQTYTSPSFTAGDHTVSLVHAGGRPYIDIDAITILP